MIHPPKPDESQIKAQGNPSRFSFCVGRSNAGELLHPSRCWQLPMSIGEHASILDGQQRQGSIVVKTPGLLLDRHLVRTDDIRASKNERDRDGKECPQDEEPDYHRGELSQCAVVPSLNAKTIENIDVVIPDGDEQVAISDLLKDMDVEIQAVETRFEKARQVKEGMMQNLLTGRIRLV